MKPKVLLVTGVFVVVVVCGTCLGHHQPMNGVVSVGRVFETLPVWGLCAVTPGSKPAQDNHVHSSRAGRAHPLDRLPKLNRFLRKFANQSTGVSLYLPHGHEAGVRRALRDPDGGLLPFLFLKRPCRVPYVPALHVVRCWVPSLLLSDR